MSVNSVYAMDQKLVQKYGKLFGTIDFSLKDGLSSEIIKQRRGDLVIGNFSIDNKDFPVTIAELDRLIETAESAKSVFTKALKLGKYV